MDCETWNKIWEQYGDKIVVFHNGGKTAALISGGVEYMLIPSGVNKIEGIILTKNVDSKLVERVRNDFPNSIRVAEKIGKKQYAGDALIPAENGGIYFCTGTECWERTIKYCKGEQIKYVKLT